MKKSGRNTEFLKKLKLAFPDKTPNKYKILLYSIYGCCGELVLARHFGCKMVYVDPDNPDPTLADAQTNPATKKLLRDNLRVKLSGFPAGARGLGEAGIKSDTFTDKFSIRIAKLLSPTEWEEEMKWAEQDDWQLFSSPEIWEQVEELAADWVSRPEMLRERFGTLKL